MALENSGLAITGDSVKMKLLQEVYLVPEKTAFVGRNPIHRSRWSPEQPKEPNASVIIDTDTLLGTAKQETARPSQRRWQQTKVMKMTADFWIRERRSTSRRTVACWLVNNVVMAADKQSMDIVRWRWSATPKAYRSKSTMSTVYFLEQLNYKKFGMSDIWHRERRGLSRHFDG